MGNMSLDFSSDQRSGEFVFSAEGRKETFESKLQGIALLVKC